MMTPLHPLASATLCAFAGLFALASAQAQTPPDAGQVLEQFQQPAQPLPPPTGLHIQPAPSQAPTPAGGPEVTLQHIALEGASVFDEQTLLGALGDYRDKAFDLAALRGLAERLTAFYRTHGYPFAMAYLPPQTVKDGRLHIRIVEGRYGQVRASGKLAAGAQPFLADLQPGEVIATKTLERTIHLLGDLPGITLSPVLMPGSEVGTGDLQVQVDEDEKYAADIGLDNYGNRYTGAWRTSATVGINRVVTFGDQLTLGAMLTDEQMWYGRLDYALPVGHSGLRAHAQYLQTYYELGGDFASLGATGDVRVSSAGLEYPLLRSARSNLILRADYQHKAIEEQAGDSAPVTDKYSNSLPLSLQFDHRGEGSVVWGVLSWTPGRLHLDSTLAGVDSLTAHSEGRFDRYNLELATLRRLTDPLTFFARLNTQWSSDNLDSSEDFSLGGANGVRAYPQGEAIGDRGALGQVELRYSSGIFAPYLFFDAGSITVNAAPWTTGNNHRYLSGGGVGVRVNSGKWSLDAAVAWRGAGGTPQADTRNDQPRLWGSAHYRF